MRVRVSSRGSVSSRAVCIREPTSCYSSRDASHWGGLWPAERAAAIDTDGTELIDGRGPRRAG